jgi:hypothetical protein
MDYYAGIQTGSEKVGGWGGRERGRGERGEWKGIIKRLVREMVDVV